VLVTTAPQRWLTGAELVRGACVGRRLKAPMSFSTGDG